MLGLTGVFGSQVIVSMHVLYTSSSPKLIDFVKLQLLYILGVYWAGPDIASAFQPVIPVWTTVLAIATCTEKLPSPFHVNSLS